MQDNIQITKIEQYKKASQNLAQLGEQLAVEFLQSKNYIILERNFRKRWVGEIDIIAQRYDGSIRLVEVKARKSENYLTLNQLISKEKIHFLKRTFKIWCAKNKINFVTSNLGIDYIGMLIDESKKQIHKLLFYENLEKLKYKLP